MKGERFADIVRDLGSSVATVEVVMCTQRFWINLLLVGLIGAVRNILRVFVHSISLPLFIPKKYLMSSCCAEFPSYFGDCYYAPLFLSPFNLQCVPPAMINALWLASRYQKKASMCKCMTAYWPAPSLSGLEHVTPLTGNAKREWLQLRESSGLSFLPFMTSLAVAEC